MVPMGPERWGPDSEEWVIHLNYPADTRAVRRADRGRRPRGARHRRPADARSTRSRAGRSRRCSRPPSGSVACSSRRRRAPAPADRRARADQRDPRRAEPLLEARRGARRPRLAGAAGDLRAPSGDRWTSATASARWRTGSTTSRSAPRSASRPRTVGGGEHGAAAPRPGAAGPRTPSTAPACCARCARSRWSSPSSTSSTATATTRPPSCADGSPAPSRSTTSASTQPSTRPGAPLPHAWIDDEDGNRRPIKDLVAPGRLPAHRRRGRRRVVRGGARARRGGGPAARRGAHRPPRRRPVRPALRLAAPSRDRARRRDPRAPGPLRRLACSARRPTTRELRSPPRSAQILARPVTTPVAFAM